MSDAATAFRAILRQDLPSFIRKSFATVAPAIPYLENWHIQAMAWHLEEVYAGRIKRLIISVPPRHLKSISASVAFPAWVLGKDPTRRIISVSYAQDIARKHALDFRSVMDATWYRKTFRGTRIDPRKNTELEIMTTDRGFRLTNDLNTHLEACCAKRWAEQLRGHDQTVGERLERDRAVLQRLPAIAYDACDKRPGRVSSLSLVRYRGTDYSVPTRFGHCEVRVRGYVHEVVISCAAEVIARHPRSYEQEDFVFDPLHYRSLLEQKTNALDQAAPLAGWLLPPVFGNLRRLLEARMGKAGKREYVQVLRLIESFSLDDVRAAISEALERGVIGFDAVKHLVLCRIEKRPPRLNLLAHPYLPRAEVATTSARSSMGLLKGAAP